MTELSTLKDKFNNTSEKNRLPLIEKIVAQGKDGYKFLRDFLSSWEGEPNPIIGKAFLTLKNSEQQIDHDFLQQKYAN